VIRIRPAASESDLDAARVLFRAYAVDSRDDPEFAQCVPSREFEAEVAGLPGEYAAPRGVILLAWSGASAAGCVACRPLAEDGVCEMKRLFVGAAFRGQGVGAHLVRELLDRSGAMGYDKLRLDTLPSMQAAQRLYRVLGFYEIPAYMENPVRGAKFFEARLETASSRRS